MGTSKKTATKKKPAPPKKPATPANPTPKPPGKDPSKMTPHEKLRAGMTVSAEEYLAGSPAPLPRKGMKLAEQTKRSIAESDENDPIKHSTRPIPDRDIPTRAPMLKPGAIVFVQWDADGPSNELFPDKGVVRRGRFEFYSAEGRAVVTMFAIDNSGAYTGQLEDRTRKFEEHEVLGEVRVDVMMRETKKDDDAALLIKMVEGAAPELAATPTNKPRAARGSKKLVPPVAEEFYSSSTPAANDQPLPWENGSATILVAPKTVDAGIAAKSIGDAVGGELDPTCPTHDLLLIPTRSGSQKVCPSPEGCDFYTVKMADGMYRVPSERRTTAKLTKTVAITKEAAHICPLHRLPLIPIGDNPAHQHLECPVGDCTHAIDASTGKQVPATVLPSAAEAHTIESPDDLDMPWLTTQSDSGFIPELPEDKAPWE